MPQQAKSSGTLTVCRWTKGLTGWVPQLASQCVPDRTITFCEIGDKFRAVRRSVSDQLVTLRFLDCVRMQPPQQVSAYLRRSESGLRRRTSARRAGRGLGSVRSRDKMPTHFARYRHFSARAVRDLLPEQLVGGHPRRWRPRSLLALQYLESAHGPGSRRAAPHKHEVWEMSASVDSCRRRLPRTANCRRRAAGVVVLEAPVKGAVDALPVSGQCPIQTPKPVQQPHRSPTS